MEDINQEILQRLVRVETKLDMIASARDTAIEALSLSKETKNRVDKIERALYWVIGIIISGVIVSIINIIINN